MKILVTGGSGFIGSFLCEELLKLNHKVKVLDNLSTGFYENIKELVKNPNFDFIEGDCQDSSLVNKLSKGVDVIFHLAAAVGVDLILEEPIRILETNIHSTDVVLKAAKENDCVVFLTSTSEIYGKSQEVPYKEDSDRILGPTTASRWAYSDSKAIDEFLALGYYKQYGTKVIIVRLFNTVGPRQTGRYGMVLPRFVNSALNNQDVKVYGDGGQQRCFMHVQDAIRAFLLLVNNKNSYGQIFNLGQNHEISILELAKKVVKATSSKSEIKLIPYEEAYQEGFEDMQRRIPDITKVSELVGWKPSINLDQIIDDVIGYSRNKL